MYFVSSWTSILKGGLLNYGDHIPNILSENETKVKHLLIAKDSTFSTQRDDNSYETRHGRVKFMQLVGCTDDELYYVQQWSASKLIDMMKETELYEFGNNKFSSYKLLI